MPINEKTMAGRGERKNRPTNNPGDNMQTTATPAENEPSENTRSGALLFYSEFDDPKEWSDALRENLPELDIRVYPEVGNPDDIAYVLAWRPPENFFEPFKNIRLVVNLGAGVDSLSGRLDRFSRRSRHPGQHDAAHGRHERADRQNSFRCAGPWYQIRQRLPW
jgi:hypothetical protein